MYLPRDGIKNPSRQGEVKENGRNIKLCNFAATCLP